MERSELSTFNLEIDKQISEAYNSHCLIGKILLHRDLNPALVKSFIHREWNCRRGLTVTHIKWNTFMFTFQDKQELAQVMKNRPWTVNGGLLTLTVCRPGQVPHESEFSCSPFWVQAHGLPLDYLTLQNGSTIGAMIGIYAYMDPSVSCSLRKCLRIRVVLDVRKPLKTGFWLKRVGLLDVWIDFKYENLGVFCYKCGRIGHSYRHCNFPIGNGRLGPWLRAQKVDYAPDPRKELPIVPTTFIAVPKAKATLIQSPTPGISESLEFELKSHEVESTTQGRNLCKRLIFNTIDSMIMVMNCGVILSRLESADGLSQGNGTLLLVLMAVYLCHLFFKFVRVIRNSRFWKGEKDYSDGNGKALKEILILLIFLFILACF